MDSICQNCGFVGEEVKMKPGSTTTQVILFVLGLLTFGAFLLVWVVYAMWRSMKTEMVCPSCNHPRSMLSLSSPRGQQLQAQFAQAPTREQSQRAV